VQSVNAKSCYCSAPVFAELIAAPRRNETFVSSFLEEIGITIDWDLGEAVWRSAGRAFQCYAEPRRKQRGSDSRRILADFLIGDLELPERPGNMDWRLNEESNGYNFCRGPEYPRDVVLNDRLGKHGIVKPGKPVTSVLLGRSATPIPSQCSHGLKPPLIFSILEGFNKWHRAQLLLPVDVFVSIRLETVPRNSTKCGVRTGPGLALGSNGNLNPRTQNIP